MRQIGHIGLAFAVATFMVMFVSIWARDHGKHIDRGIIDAFVLAVTIVVVAIPEGRCIYSPLHRVFMMH